MRKTINRPNYLNKQRIQDRLIYRPKQSIKKESSNVLYLNVPYFYYCPIIGAIYSHKLIIIECC
jgi:hypothetical protein